MSIYQHVKKIKQILEDDYMKITEVYLEDEAIPYWITEKIQIEQSEFIDLIEPLKEHIDAVSYHRLLTVMQQGLKKTQTRYGERPTQYYDVVYYKLEKSILFDELDELAYTGSIGRVQSVYEDDIILYVTGWDAGED